MKHTILFLDQQSWRGGAQRVLEEVLAALEQDFVPLVGFPEDGPFAAEFRQRGIETLIYPLGRYRSGRKSITESAELALRSLACGLQLARTILRRKVRLVYINGPRCLPAGVIAARLTGRPTLFHLHLILSRRADLFLAARTVREVTTIVSCSEAAAGALQSVDPRLASITRVLYNPAVNSAPGKPFASESTIPAVTDRPSVPATIGMVGRITPAKGHHLLLHAASDLNRSGRELRLSIVGAPAPGSQEDSSYFQSLESVARACGLAEKVRWVGYQADPHPFYSLMDVLVIPSTVSEAFSMVALEAFQHGVPVIASRLGGIPEIVRNGENGLLFPPGDEKALEKSLERFLSDPLLRARLRAGARLSIDERFSQQTFRSTIHCLVSALCGRGETFSAAVRPKEFKAQG